MKWNQIALAFLIGLLIGTAAGSSYRRLLKKPWDRNAMHDRLIKKISRRLDLSSDQKNKVEKIFDANRSKADAIFAEVRPKLESLRKETGAEIKKILSPEQQAKYDKLDVEMASRMKRHFPPPPPPPEPDRP